MTDGIPAEVRFNRQQEREEAGLDRAPIQPLQPFEEKRYRKLLSSERTAPGGLYQVRFRDLHPAGVYTVRLKIEGWLSERSRFERVALTTLGRETNTRFS